MSLPDPGESDFPSVLSAAQLLPAAGHLELSRSDLLSTHSASVSAKTGVVEAFHLLLVFHLLVSCEHGGNISSSRNTRTLDVWHELQRKTRRKLSLTLLAGELLEYTSHLVEHEGDFEVEEILYTEFLYDSSQSRKIRVIDLLSHPEIPPEVLRHPLVTMAVSKLWKYGKNTSGPGGPDASYFQRFLTMYDSCSSPRVQHGVHLLFHSAYLILLVHFILYSERVILIRELFIVVYCLTNVSFLPRFSLLSLPHVLVIVAFLFSLPSTPTSTPTLGSGAYDALLFAFCLHILAIQLPMSPTPMLLLEPARCLPLSSLYSRFFTHYLLPIFAFFLPVLLISTLLLSISLSADPWSVFLASPPAGRFVFFWLLTFILFTVIFFFLAFAFFRAPSPSGDTNNSYGYWEGYGIDAGLLGRRALVRATSLYSASPSGSMVFPPPLNAILAPLALGSLSRETRSMVWRLVVGPIAFLIAAFWWWS